LSFRAKRGTCFCANAAKQIPRAPKSSARNDKSLLSNGFSRKLENHAPAVALNYFAYNFIKIHRALRVSPAMAAGVETRLWSVEDLGCSLGVLRTAEGGKSSVNEGPIRDFFLDGDRGVLRILRY